MPDASHADDRVDFYVLPDARPRGRQLLACRLAEKAYQQGYKAYIQTASREQAVLMDELLWTFKDIGFVPHVLASDPAGDSAPVVLGHPPLEPPAGAQMLINLDAAVPTYVARF